MLENNYLKGLAEAIAPFLMPYFENKVRDELVNYTPNSKTDELELLTKKQVIERFQISAMTLWRLEQSGELIPVRLGSRVMYRIKDLNTFFK